MITKKSNLSSADFAAGEAILIDKEKDKSSFFAVNALRHLTGVKKIGHAGTLDPFATGLLILCSGKMTKSISGYQDLPKTYSGVITLGGRTESMDTETPVTDEKSVEGITDDKIFEVRNSFLGSISQIPPMYSALKHKGKSLYKYARKGIEIKREARSVTVYEFDLLNINLPDVEFKIVCSKGTYIRVIADDFGKLLGCGGYLSKLRRTAIGGYSVDDAFTINELEDYFKKI